MANIGATTAFYKVETSLTRANSEVSKSMERLATGKANANAGDRSSYVAMADTFRLDFVGTKAGVKGASVTMGYLETGMRVLDSASALLSRLQELAVLGANDTNTTADHEAINLEAEAISDEFNRLMTTSTYKGRDVFNTTAGSLYVSMGGRDQEMTFGIGTINYSQLYAATERTIAGATTATPKAFGQAANIGLGNGADLVANKTYIITAAAAGGQIAYNAGAQKAGLMAADTSAIYRATNSDNVAVNTGAANNMLLGDVLVANALIQQSDMDATVKLKEVLTGANAFVAGQTYTISSMGGSDGNTGTALSDAAAIKEATSIAGGTLTAGTSFTVNANASIAQMAHLNALEEGITFTSASETANDIAGPNKDGKFNLAHLPSDAVVVKTLGGASETGRSGTAGLEADKTYIIRAITSDETDYFGTAGQKAPLVQVGASAIYRQAGGNTAITAGSMTIGDVVVMSSAVAGAGLDGTMRVDEVNTTSNRILAGHEYEIVSRGNSTGVVNTASYTSDAGAIGRASSDVANSSTLVEGSKFTVDADVTTTNLAYLNALTEGMTFRMTTDTLTKDIEAMQGLVNTARVQAGSQYAAIESAVNYTTDLTAQYELGYNTVNDVNFSMETAHLARNQILQQAATAMLAQANQGQQSLLQLISR